MWKKDVSDWEKQQNYIRYDYVLDLEVCDYCRTDADPRRFGRDKICKLETFYNELTEKDQMYCPGGRFNLGSTLNLIEILRTEREKDDWTIHLYAAKDLDNEYREHEEVSFSIGKNGWISKRMIGADYDPYLTLDLPSEEILKTVAEIPLFNDGDTPSEEEIGLKLNILDGNKQEWLKAYDNFFKDLQARMNKEGKGQEPLI